MLQTQQRRPQALEYLRTIRNWQIQDRSLIIDGGWEGQVWLTPAFPGVVEVRLVRGTPWSREPNQESLSVDREAWPQLPPPQVVEREDCVLAAFPGVLVRVQKQPVRLSFWATPVADESLEGGAAGPGRPAMLGPETARMIDADRPAVGPDAAGGGAAAEAPAALPEEPPLLSQTENGGLWMDGWEVGVRFDLWPGERFFGLGEPDQRKGPIPVDHRGRRYPVWHKHLPAPSRLVLPVLVSSRGYGLFIDNPWPAEWDLGSDGAHFGYTARGGQMVYYFVAGPELTTVLRRYTRLTGRPALAPRWGFGLLQSKFGYKNRAEVEELVATFREKGIPLDCIILDLYWFKRMGDLCFDRTAFPDPEEMVRKLREDGIRIITIEEPYVTRGSRLFPEAERLGLLGRRPDGSPYTFPFWAGETGLVDFTQPLARQWWAEKHRELLRMGIAGWWTDLNEPEEHPPDMIHAGGPAAAVRNTYALQMIRALALMQELYRPEGRLFVLSRAGWPGIQALGAGQWSGDVATRWSDLANQIPLGLSMAMAGFAYWNTDIGGFTGDPPSPELYVRWIQFGAFTPTMRPHGAHQGREPWAFGEEAERIAVEYIRLRYRLLPYTYTIARECYDTGLPMMRPLVLHYPDDPRTHALTDQYLWGRDILVAPVVTEGATQRRVYLPEGEWYDFWTGRRMRGGRTITAQAPLERLPLYVRAGAIIPMAPEDRQRTGERLEELTLAVFPGAAPFSFTLYEDDGETTGYRRGEYATIGLHSEPAGPGGGLVIRAEAPHGAYRGMPAERLYRLEVRLPTRPAAVALDGQALQARRSAQSLERSGSGWWYDRRARVLHVKCPPVAGGMTVAIA